MLARVGIQFSLREMKMQREFLHETLYRGEEALEKLRTRIVTIAGCGAIGSWTSLFLAKMGVRMFSLFDFDIIEEHNRSTQLWEARDVKRYKATVLRRLLHRHGATAWDNKKKIMKRNIEGIFWGVNVDPIVCSFDNAEGRSAMLDFHREWNTPPPQILFVGMEGEQMYSECIWAEDYQVPPDPEIGERLDVCDYALATTLCTLTSSIAAEIVAHYIITGEKKSYRGSLLELMR